MNTAFTIELTNKSNSGRKLDVSKLKPELSYFFGKEPTQHEREIASILVSSWNYESELYSIPYLTRLVKEVEDCMNGESEIGAGWGNEMASVGTGKEMTKVWSNLSDNSQGEIPTSEILQLLKDWKVFLEKFYSLGWGVVKEDIKEEARSKYIKE